MKISWIHIISTIIFVFIIIAYFLLNSDRNYAITEPNIIDNNTIILPVKIHLLIDKDGYFTTSRTEKNITVVFDQVNRIWSQANISFEIKEIVYEAIESEDIYHSINSDPRILASKTSFDATAINIYFAKTVGANGRVIGNYIMIADKTTVHDYRATSHELGHILGLDHDFESENRLMYQGVNGEELTEEDIRISRKNAEKFLAR